MTMAWHYRFAFSPTSMWTARRVRTFSKFAAGDELWLIRRELQIIFNSFARPKSVPEKSGGCESETEIYRRKGERARRPAAK